MNETLFWDSAYRDNAPALLGVLRRYMRETDVAQDLLHEVFITAINRYDSYAGKGSFEGWLHRITVNTALMYLRSERNKPATTDALLTIAGDNAPEEDPSGGTRTTIEAAGFSGEELLAAIDRLPEHHKMVFNMYVMDDFSHKQIGAMLHISPGTSKSHLARARKRIQQFLYNDALNKEKNNGKRRASAFVLLFPAKVHFIDQLYREGLSDFTLPPAGDTGFLSAALEQHAASVASQMAASAAQSVASAAAPATTQAIQTAAFWGSKLSYMAVCCSTAAVTGSACWLAMGDNSPLNSGNNTAPATDTTMYSPKPVVTDHVTYDATNDLSPGPSPQERGVVPTTDDNVAISQPAGQQGSEEDGASSPGNGIISLREGSDTPSAGSGVGSPSTARQTTGKKQPEPVVVKKQIIQHQTVVIRDTIIITE